MKKLIGLLFAILSVMQVAYSQEDCNDLMGKWILKESNNDIIFDCADIIVFEEDSTYEILNECYGVDRRSPVIERGAWEFIHSSQIIVLSKRELLSSYVFQNKDKILSIYVRKFDDKEITVSYSNEPNSCRDRFLKQ